ncbi:type IV secretion system protein, partial [Xanthomonas arboricola]
MLRLYPITAENKTPEDQVDESLGWMQVALSSIDVLDVVQDPTLDSQKSHAMWMVGIGIGGQAVVAGSMMLLYRIAMALFVGFGPLFILCLLFEQTKSLFNGGSSMEWNLLLHVRAGSHDIHCFGHGHESVSSL